MSHAAKGVTRPKTSVVNPAATQSINTSARDVCKGDSDLMSVEEKPRPGEVQRQLHRE